MGCGDGMRMGIHVGETPCDPMNFVGLVDGNWNRRQNIRVRAGKDSNICWLTRAMLVKNEALKLS